MLNIDVVAKKEIGNRHVHDRIEADIQSLFRDSFGFVSSNVLLSLPYSC